MKTTEIYFYRIRHIPTGLFYQPVKGRWQGEKSNFGENGKVYARKPSVKDVNTNGVRISDTLCKKYNLQHMTEESRWEPRQQHFKEEFSNLENFEVVTYKLVEV